MQGEWPIVFTDHSVRDILANLKSQTRRVIKSPNGAVPVDFYDGMFWFRDGSAYRIDCVYKKGDFVWVREAWARVEPYPEINDSYSMPYPDSIAGDKTLLAFWKQRIIYRADHPNKTPDECGCGSGDNRWRSPFHLPRWASRITIKITDVRFERLHEISTEDCIAEGMRTNLREQEAVDDLCDQYQKVWNDINLKRGLGWDKNPLVWVVSFRMVQPW